MKRTLSLFSLVVLLGFFPHHRLNSVYAVCQPMGSVSLSFSARMITKLNVPGVLLYSDGHETHLLQMARNLHHHLRLGLLIQEFRKRIDTPIRLVIGNLIPKKFTYFDGFSALNDLYFIYQTFSGI